MFTFQDAVAWIWLAGAIAMALCAIVSYLRLMRRKDREPTPFIYGFFKPKIHVPNGIGNVAPACIMAHKNAHIRRGEHMVKPFAYVLLCIHWFNPLAWLAFALMCTDMETSCDERVIRELGSGAKADYSQALLSLSMPTKGAKAHVGHYRVR